MGDKLAVVSGGGTGIGAAAARVLVSDGYEVLIAGRRAEVLRAAADRIGNDCGRPDAVTPVAADLADPAGVERVVAAVAGTSGRRVD